MSMNCGQTLDLSCFPHTFLLLVTPGHGTKEAFSDRMMQFELINLFSNKKVLIMCKLLSKYEQELRSIIGATLFPILTHRPRDDGTIA